MEFSYLINCLPGIAKHYPKPKAPMLPTLNWHSINKNGSNKTLSYFETKNAIHLPSGRLAIYYALKRCGVQKGDSVLVPAYHCGSMIEPIIWLDAKPVFVDLDEQLLLNVDELSKKCTPESKALILTHFFGFPQNIDPIRDFCDKNDIKLIEDCAHAYFSKTDNKLLGSIGDFSITSTVKFFAGTSGGVLIDNNQETEIELKPVGFVQQIKNLKHLLEYAASYGRLSYFGKLVDNLFNKQPIKSINYDNFQLVEQKETSTQEKHTLHKNNLIWFDYRKIGNGPSFVDMFIEKHTNKQDLIAKRRENFDYYLSAFSDSPNIKPLFKKLPQGVTPYVFPLILEKPLTHFPLLKLAGIPIWRWEELLESDCSISDLYRESLIQLPCHQSLKPTEVDWIIHTLKQITQE